MDERPHNIMALLPPPPFPTRQLHTHPTLSREDERLHPSTHTGTTPRLLFPSLSALAHPPPIGMNTLITLGALLPSPFPSPYPRSASPLAHR